MYKIITIMAIGIIMWVVGDNAHDVLIPLGIVTIAGIGGYVRAKIGSVNDDIFNNE